MGKVILAALVLSMNVSVARADDASLQAARQVVGLLTQGCLQFAGNATGLRDALRRKGVPELKQEARAIFMRDKTGSGFDASNKTTRLAIVSKDNGLCDVVLGDKSGADVVPLLEESLKRIRIEITKEGEEDRGQMHVTFFSLRLRSQPFKIVASTNNHPVGSITSIVTLSPEAH